MSPESDCKVGEEYFIGKKETVCRDLRRVYVVVWTTLLLS
jgi:hypothetical protein